VARALQQGLDVFSLPQGKAAFAGCDREMLHGFMAWRGLGKGEVKAR
jgi:hypothetical protein